MLTFGLIGFPLTHSFSEKYFLEKFQRERISDVQYKLFPLANLSEFREFILDNPGIRGLNVTIPYKQKIISFLDELDVTAKAIGAVNTIKFVRTADRRRILIGHNTDAYGFEISIRSFLGKEKPQALILGSGGGSKAVQYVLNKLRIPFTLVSRKKKTASSDKNQISYEDLNEKIILENKLIINTSPLGMFPDTESFPPIPYVFLDNSHFIYDLVYNPEETTFLKKGKEQGANIMNGMEMLQLQAERSWQIWNQF